MTQEALTLALEALENPNSGLVPHKGEWNSRQSIAITAIKEALAQTQEPEIKTTDPFESSRVADYNRGWNDCLFASGIMKQPEQEPVGDEWTPCMKLPVVVHVRKQRLGEAHISTREGITPVKPDDLIMRGVSGEEYPIGRAIFERTYSFNTAPPQRTERPVDCERCNRLEEQAYDLVGKLRVANIKLSMQPQRTWVDLTDEELKSIEENTTFAGNESFLRALTRNIEAKLKELNT